MDEDTFNTTFSSIWSRYRYSRDSRYSYYSIYSDIYNYYIQKLVDDDFELFHKICDYYCFLRNESDLKDATCFIKHAYIIYHDRDVKNKLKNYTDFDDLMKINFEIKKKLD